MPTLSDLRTRAKQRADMVGSDFISDTEWNQYISDSYGALYDLLVGKFEDYYLSDPYSFTVAAGSDSASLPADFLKLKGVDYSDGGTWREVKRFNFNERNVEAGFARYRLYGSTILFAPSSQAPGSYRLWYIPRAAVLSNDADTVDCYGWEVWIEVDAARKALIKEESDTSGLERELATIAQRIETAARDRDVGEPGRITDVTTNDFLSNFDRRLF